MMKGLMDRCASHKTVVGCLRAKVGAKEIELQKLMSQKEVQVNKLDLTLKKIHTDKEEEISEAKGHLCQAKENAVREYRDSDTLLKELGGSFADGFNDCFRQVKASFPDLDLSHISIDAQAQTPAHPIYFEGTDKLFTDDSTHDPQGAGETAHEDQGKFVEDEVRPIEGNHIAEEKDRKNPIDRQQFIKCYATFFKNKKNYWENNIDPFCCPFLGSFRCKCMPFCGLLFTIFIYLLLMFARLFVVFFFFFPISETCFCPST